MFKNKNLVIDTSVLVSSPTAINQFSDCNIFLTIEILEELDKLKTKRDQVGKCARAVNRYLDQLRETQSLITGAETENGSTIYVINGKGKLAGGLEESSNDNKIISVSYILNEKMGDVIVLSNDIAFRLKCDSLGLKAVGYDPSAKRSKDEEKYSGMKILEVPKSDIDYLYQDGELDFEEENFLPNECIMLKCGSNSALAVAKSPTEIRVLKWAGGKGFEVEGIKPRSAEQVFAFEMLLEPAMSLVTMTGISGCGKTLLAIAAGMKGLHEGLYDKVLIARPIESTSKSIGFLPGPAEEKLAPWLQPIFDNLNIMYAKKGEAYIERLLHNKKIEVSALEHIRGRSLPRAYFIVDEAQNINQHEAKALITRMGEGSKLVLIGDVEQIDCIDLDESTSGLSVAIEIFKDFEGAGHISMKKGERSALATFAAENM